jgi:hypothetical protein
MSQIVTVEKLPPLEFQHPTALLISGTTGSGKSYFTKNLVEYGAISGDIKNIWYFMPKYEHLDIIPPRNQKLFVIEGLPTKDWMDQQFKDKKRDNLIIIDDQWGKCVNSELCEHLLGYGRRHYGVSLIFISQNYYEKGTHSILMR